MNVQRLAEDALAKSWIAIRGLRVLRKDYPRYVTDFHDNLVHGINLLDFEQDLTKGRGGELKPKGRMPPKFNATYSSAALTVNTFAPFRRRIGDLIVAETNLFTNMCFEKQLNTGFFGVPNLDVLCEGTTVLAVESKCIEYLRTDAKAETRRRDPRPPFSLRYEAIEHLLDERYRSLYKSIKSDPGVFAPVAVTQLVKHYFGIRSVYDDRPVILAYLYWEPKDWASYPLFALHRSQLQGIRGVLQGSSVKFCAMSYAELWAEMLNRSRSVWVADHIANLRRRYEVSLTPVAASLTLDDLSR